ncbi:MAG: hypothetical protein LBT14_11085 [Treponema sp.]|jgi:hypothetical protein|nr:hypothetical protein [Treponema sp.]
MRDSVNHLIQFRHNADGTHALYINEEPTDLRIYSVQTGDEPVKLDSGGRIVSALVWYAEGGPYEQKKRAYTSEEAALDTEIKRFDRWYDRAQEKLAEEEAEDDGEEYDPSSINPHFKATGLNRYALFLWENGNEETEVDTGFIIECSGNAAQEQSESTQCQIYYDGQIWYTAPWLDLDAIIGHIMLHIGTLLFEGPQALKAFTAEYTWLRGKDGTHRLFDAGEDTGIAVRSGGSFCYYGTAAAPQEILPTLRAAQIEAELHYIKGRLEEDTDFD